MIPNIVITFNESVTGAGSTSAYQLHNATTNESVALAAASTAGGGKTVVTLTPPSISSADGYYSLTAFGSATPFTGTSRAIGADVLDFHRFAGDHAGDTAADGGDQASFAPAVNSVAGDANYVISLDLNGDGAVDGDGPAMFAQSYALGILWPRGGRRPSDTSVRAGTGLRTRRSFATRVGHPDMPLARREWLWSAVKAC